MTFYWSFKFKSKRNWKKLVWFVNERWALCQKWFCQRKLNNYIFLWTILMAKRLKKRTMMSSKFQTTKWKKTVKLFIKIDVKNWNDWRKKRKVFFPSNLFLMQTLHIEKKKKMLNFIPIFTQVRMWTQYVCI